VGVTSESDPIRRPTKPIDPIGTVKRHWLKILVFGTALFLPLSLLPFMFQQPYYLAIGKLRISPATATFIARYEETPIAPYYKDYVRTQVDRMKEPEILEKAIDKLPANIKPIFAPEGISLSSAVTILGKQLKVKHIMGTHLILLNLSRGSPRGLAEIINNVMEVYLEKLQTEEEGKDHRRLIYLNKEKERLDGEIVIYGNRYKQIAESVGTSSFSELYNIHNGQVAALQKEYVAAYANRAEKENLLMAAKREADFLKGISLDPLVDEMVEKDESLWDTAWWTYKTLQEMRASLDGVTKDNPDRKYVEERMKGMSKYLGKLRSEVRDRAHRIIYEKRDVEIKQKIIKAESAFEAAKEEEQEILQELHRAKAQSAKTSQNMLEGQQVETRLKSLREVVNRIGNRITELKLESRAPGRVSLESRARKPEIPAGSNLKQLFIIVFMLPFGLVTVICFLFDLTDNRVRSRKDVVNALGAPPTWPISDYLVTGGKGIPFSNVTLDDPSNVVSKAIRSLAVKLNKEREEHAAKLTVVTGVDSKSGVTEILLNTAHAMALICEKVLVIDLNFVNPTLGRLVEVEEESKGLVDFLLGRAEIQECIVRDEKRGLDLLPAGHRPTRDELALLNKSKILKMLNSLKDQYEFLFVDTVPILVSDLTEFLVVRADIVTLVIQGDRSLYKNLYLAGDVLIRFEIPAIAPVLNWGAPRYRSKGQKIVYNILRPIQRRMTEQPEVTADEADEDPLAKVSPEGSETEEVAGKTESQTRHFWDRIRRKTPPKSKPVLILMGLGMAAALVGGYAAKSKELPLLSEGKTGQQSVKVSGSVKSLPQTRKPIQPVRVVPVQDARQTAMAKGVEEQQAPLGKHGIALDLFPEEDLEEFFKADVLAAMQEKSFSDWPVKHPADTGLKTDPGKPDPGLETEVATQKKVEGKTGALKGESWILRQRPKAYTIQLLGVADKASLVHFVKTHGLEGNIACFHKKHKRRDWYSLIYGLYPDKASALKGARLLPERLREAGPWVRRLGSIQQDISKQKNTG